MRKITLHQYYQAHNIKEDEMGSAYRTHGRDKKCVKSFSQKSEVKKPVGNSRCRRKDNIKMHLQKRGREGEDRIQDRDQ
jgi:hypothetical protein